MSAFQRRNRFIANPVNQLPGLNTYGVATLASQAAVLKRPRCIVRRAVSVRLSTLRPLFTSIIEAVTFSPSHSAPARVTQHPLMVRERLSSGQSLTLPK